MPLHTKKLLCGRQVQGGGLLVPGPPSGKVPQRSHVQAKPNFQYSSDEKNCCYEIMINCLIDIHWSWSWSQGQSRFIFEGSKPEPPKIGRLRNSARSS